MNYVNKSLKNFSNSAVWNIIGQSINFFILIYLPRVLGPSGYGIFNSAQSYIMYFFLLCDLGLSFYCVKVVNQSNEKKKLINKIYNVKFYISILATVIFYISIIFIGKSFDQKLTLMCIGISIFFTGITVDYLFNTLSNMKFSGISVGIKNLVFGILCFLFVKNKNDVYMVSIAYTISILVGQVFLLVKFNKIYFKLKIRKINFEDFKLIKLSLPLAIGTFMVQINNNFDIVYLSFLKEDKEVGYYSAAYKIINFLIAIMCIYINSAYPIIAQLINKNRKELNKFISKFYYIGEMIVLPIVFGGIALSGPIIDFLFGKQYYNSKILFILLMPLIFIRMLTATYGSVLMMGEGSKYFSRGVMIGAIINIILNIILTPYYGAKGSAVATLICESVQGIYLFIKYKKYCDSKFMYLNIKFLICSAIMSLALIYIKCNLFLSILLGIIIYFSTLCTLNIFLKVFTNHKMLKK